MHKALTLLIVMLVVSACTGSAEVETITLDLEQVSISIPTTWVRLDEPWINQYTIDAFGNRKGTTNQQSVIIYRFPHQFDLADSPFNEEDCHEYYRLTNTTDVYDQPSTEYTLHSIRIDQLDDSSQYCEINYSLQQSADVRVDLMELVIPKENTLFSIEASATEDADFELAKQVARTVVLKQ